MSWRQSTGRECCLSCKRQIDAGAPIYRGERTPCDWCADCAEYDLGETPGGPVPLAPVEGQPAGFDVQAMGAKLRAAILEKRARERDGHMAATGERE